MKKTYKPLEVYAIAATAVLVLLLVLVGSGKLQAVSYTPNLTTQAYSFQGWSGATSSSSYAATNGGLNDRTDYVASWSPNLIGQQVNLQGFLNKPTVSLCGVPDVWGYRAELYEPAGPQQGWNTILQGGQATDPVNRAGVDDWKNPNFMVGELITYSTNMAGYIGSGPIAATSTYVILQSPDGKTVIPEGSVVHAEFWAHFGVCIGVGTGWVKLSSGEAWVHTGIGTVSWDTDPALYQVGQTATCSWNVGYIGGGQTWNVFVTSRAQGGATVASQVGVSTLTGSLSYVVKVADWSPNKGVLICHLYNNLWSKDFVTAGVIDNTSLAPQLTVTGISPQSPKQGDSVTVTWNATVNPITKAPLSKIEIIWGWGSGSNDVLLPGNSTSYTFTASQSGYVRLSVGAWDAAGRPSGFRNLQIQIDAQPPLGGSSNAGGNLDLVAIILLLVGIGTLLAGLYLIKNPLWRIPFFAVGGILSFVGILLAIMSVTAWIAGLFPGK